MKIELLDKSHDRTRFECESQQLTDYFRRQVSQDTRKGLTACFVATKEPDLIIGYYTLSSQSLGRDAIPEEFKKKLPQSYDAPVILLGRLARDISMKGKGLGEYLLMDALFRSYWTSVQSIGAMAVVTDPIDEPAANFYKKYGFITLPDSRRMFLPMQVIAKLKVE